MIAYYAVQWTFLLLIGLMMFVLPVGVLLVVLLVRSHNARRVFLYVGAGVLVVALAGFILLINARLRLRAARIPMYKSTHATLEPVTPPTISGNGNRELPFEPDVYASKASAILGAARTVARQYEQRITSADQRPQTVRLSSRLGMDGETGDEINFSRQSRGFSVSAGPAARDGQFFSYESSQTQLMARVADEIAHVLGARNVAVSTGLAETETRPALATVSQGIELSAVELSIDLIREASADFDSGQHGLLRATLAGPLGSFSRQAAFVDKPWGEDFERWRSRGGYADWVEGQSDLLCASADEARDQAMADATRRVIDTVLTHGEKQGRRGTLLVSARRNQLESWLGDVVPRWLATGQLQTDSFVQTYERPYGTLYRCATRVHVPPAKADMLLDTFTMHDRALRTTWLRAILSAVGLLVLISVVYLFLNAATRGYYVWSVRIAAVVMAGFGAWCVLMLM